MTSDFNLLKDKLQTIENEEQNATNWQDGIIKSRSTFVDDNRLKILLFASDGMPTLDNQTPIGGGGIDNIKYLNSAVVEANIAKQNKIRILAIGIGLAPYYVTSLQAISGPIVDHPDIFKSDVVMTNFDKLADRLAEFAKKNCEKLLFKESPIKEDVNDDKCVNSIDYQLALSKYGLELEPGQNDIADVNYDGLINGFDLTEIISSFGQCQRN